MSRVNKFSTEWQIVRVEARKLKLPAEKVALVHRFLRGNPTFENAQRAKNWAAMTKVAYREDKDKRHFDVLLDYIRDGDFDKKEKELDPPEDHNSEDLLMVYKDLKKRKNNFMHGGKAPKDQVEFMAKVEKVLDDRGVDY
jgi:hypothetical protein